MNSLYTWIKLNFLLAALLVEWVIKNKILSAILKEISDKFAYGEKIFVFVLQLYMLNLTCRYAFVAPGIVDGKNAQSPVGELGMVEMTQALE